MLYDTLAVENLSMMTKGSSLLISQHLAQDSLGSAQQIFVMRLNGGHDCFASLCGPQGLSEIIVRKAPFPFSYSVLHRR
jgi:hypothetical protein